MYKLAFVLLQTGSLEELIKHGLRALRDTLPNEVELTNKVETVNCATSRMILSRCYNKQ